MAASRRRRERLAVFHPEFREDLEHVLRDPFEGIGKPEPLRFYMQGCWSRRVTQEHRSSLIRRLFL